MAEQLISIIIRTYNEEKHLRRLLYTIEGQKLDDGWRHEVVIVDSGSSDTTLEIASSFERCRITHIRKEDFSFGRSLNVGCEFAKGEYFTFVSGHCIPTSDRWLHELVCPLGDGRCQYTYGRQIGAETTKFSESQLFAKYFPEHSLIPQEGFFCNNANAAITRPAWAKHRFDESLTGLEDMDLARRLTSSGGAVGYVAEAGVFHIHDESWRGVRHRYEREAVAMQRIAPNLHVTPLDGLRFFSSAVLHDISAALDERTLLRHLPTIMLFRAMQYWGTYRGNREHRKLSHEMKLRYYYPTRAHHPEAKGHGLGREVRSSAI